MIPVTPHRKMFELDEAGEAYWIEDLVVPGMELPKLLDVYAHDDEWMVVAQHDGDNLETLDRTFINMRWVASMRIVEG